MLTINIYKGSESVIPCQYLEMSLLQAHTHVYAGTLLVK